MLYDGVSYSMKYNTGIHFNFSDGILQLAASGTICPGIVKNQDKLSR